MTFEELLLALEEHSNLISNETKIGHNTNVRVGLLGKKVAEILRKQGDAGERYLSKIDDDIAKGIITFLKGIVVGDFNSGLFGSGGAIRNINGTTVAEFDQLLIRQRAEFLSVLIHQAKHIGGELILSAAEMVCIKMEETTDFYRCYFDADGGKVVNLFENTDYARHQVFTGNKQKFYWRKVVAVGPDYIELSKTDAAVNSDVPAAGEYIFQLGSTNPERQGAIILSTVGDDAPSIKQYVNIDTYALSNENEYTVFSRKGNKIQGKTVFRSDGLNYDDWADGTSQDIQDAQAAAAAAALKAQQAIDDAEANVTDYNAKFAEIQAQVDGEISNYSYPYTPTLLNYPASDWATDIEKDRHIGDVFHNSQAYVDNETTPDSGKAWRFVKNGTTYSWTLIADSDAVKAIQEASKAQAMADGKSTTYLFQPTKYKLGDMWVLNADTTVNGIAYKQGDLLTATQDSETFVQAHWLKRVRYTDDTAVNDLEIGSRNYAIGNNSILSGITNVPFGWGVGFNTGEIMQFTDSPFLNELTPYYHIKVTNARVALNQASPYQSISCSEGENFTISAKGVGTKLESWVIGIRSDGSEFNLNPSLQIPYNLKTKRFEGSFTIPVNCIGFYVLRLGIGVSGNSTGEAIFNYIKISKGNKATDWTPAPEDVEASIETAKTDAENAAQEYANTKAEAERVLAEAYADGIVSDEEQARIDDVNDKLAAAKEYAESQDALLKIQQEAYADGEISKAEQAAIQAAEDYADLKKTEAQAYADGIVSDEEARAIADALDKYNASKAHAETLVNNIEIGGRNLLLNTNRKIENSTYLTAILHLGAYKPIQGEIVTIAFKGTLGAGKTNFGIFNSSDSVNMTYIYPYDKGSDGVFRKTFQWNIGGSSNTSVLIFSMPNSSAVSSVEDVMLVVGNKIAYYSEAPEDTQAAIDGLGGYMEGAFQDSVIDKAEAKAIGEHLKTINDRYVTDNAVYNNLIDNSFLIAGTVRTTLQNVMQNIYRRDKPLLDTAINNIVNNKTVTTPLRTAFNTAFTNYRSAITSFQTAVENARKTIEAQRVANIEIGGRNLLIGSTDEWKTVNAYSSQTYIHLPFTETKLEAGQTYVFSWETELLSGSPTTATQVVIGAGVTSYQRDILWTSRRIIGKQYRVFTPTEANLSLGNSFMLRWYTNNEVFSFRYRKLKLEKGNKPTADWSPALEDVDKKISDVDAKAAEAQAKANKSAAITDKFATEINGGLITTVMMLLREVNSQINTAGFSGIQGALLDQPSYWSGGTYEQALTFVPFVKKLENEQSTTLAEYNNLPSVVILHNGAAKIGHFIVLTTGEILIIDKNSGAIKLKFSTSDLPAIADLIAGTNSSGSTPVGAGVATNSSSQVVSGSTQITKNGATATFNGTYISISATGKVQTNGIESFAEAVLYARKDGVRLHRLATSIVDFHSEVYEEKYNEWPPIPRSFITDAGKYTFELVVHTEGLVSSATAITSSTNFSWKHVVAGVKQQQYAKDGMMFFYSNRHFYFNELIGLDVKESDSSKFNMPGVLAAGSSTSGGFQSNVWGAKSSTANMTPITGGFRVPLSSLSHSNYVVQITPHTNTTFRVGTKTSTYFEVYGTGGFDYVVIGNNYA